MKPNRSRGAWGWTPEFQFEMESRAVAVRQTRIHLVNSPQHAATSLDMTPMQALRPQVAQELTYVSCSSI